MTDARTNLSLQVVENVKDNLNQNIYKTIIPRNIRLAEAPSYGMPINLYDPKSTGATSYSCWQKKLFIKEKSDYGRGKRNGLGKGLDSLIPNKTVKEESASQQKVSKEKQEKNVGIRGNISKNK